MKNNTSFIVKILLLSGGLSIAIKYGGPYLAIPATTGVVLSLIFLPSLLLALLLGWRAWRSTSSNSES